MAFLDQNLCFLQMIEVCSQDLQMHFYICIPWYVSQLHLLNNGIARPAVLLNTIIFSCFLILKLSSATQSCITLYVHQLIHGKKKKKQEVFFSFICTYLKILHWPPLVCLPICSIFNITMHKCTAALLRFFFSLFFFFSLQFLAVLVKLRFSRMFDIVISDK